MIKPGQNALTISAQLLSRMGIDQSLHALAIVGSKHSRLVHVAAVHFDAQDGFAIAFKAVRTVPASLVAALDHPVNLNVAIIFFLFKKGHFV